MVTLGLLQGGIICAILIILFRLSGKYLSEINIVDSSGMVISLGIACFSFVTGQIIAIYEFDYYDKSKR
jgi:hypothetical protein